MSGNTKPRRLILRVIVSLAATVVVAAAVAAVATTAAGTGGSPGQPPPFKLWVFTHHYQGRGGAVPVKAYHPEYRPCSALSPNSLSGKVIDPSAMGIPVSISASQYGVTSLWQDVRNNMDIYVYGGWRVDDPSQGVIIVQEQNQCLLQDSEAYYPSPKALGALTITGVHGDAVDFSYPGGTGRFDVGTHQFS